MAGLLDRVLNTLLPVLEWMVANPKGWIISFFAGFFFCVFYSCSTRSPEHLDATPPPQVAEHDDAFERRAQSLADALADADPAASLVVLVRRGQPFAIKYNGAYRVIHPYRLGPNPNTGNILLRAWEESKDGQPVNAFRTYNVSKIEGMTIALRHAPIDLPPQAYAPDKTIPSPIAERPRPQQ